MIVIDLSCSAGHRFEAWFPSAEAFVLQSTANQVSCPQCGRTKIERIPAAAHIARHGRVSGHRNEIASVTGGKSQSATQSQPEGVTALKHFVGNVLRGSEDVGTHFATEVRRIHNHEAPTRSIHGQASREDVESLVDEGIPVLPIPKLEREDLN